MNVNKALFAKLQEWASNPAVGCYCPPPRPTKEHVDELYEQFHYYNRDQLDPLINALEGSTRDSATKEAAVARLRQLMKEVFGGYLPNEPEHVLKERARNSVRAERKRAKSSEPIESEDTSETEEDNTMSKVAIKSKSEVSKLKKANPVATKSMTSKGRGRPGAYEDSQSIKVLAKENPKREGSDGYKRFELYRKNKTVGAFLKAGGTAADLRWDVEKGFIKVS